MAESGHLAEGRRPPARLDRHRIAAPAAEPATSDGAAPATQRPTSDAAECTPAPATPPAPPPAPAPLSPAERRPAPRGGPVSLPVDDKTGRAVRRPALLSDRCLECGATTRGRAGMVTELVEVGPIRALRVVACSACPERRPRGTGL